jgi:CBS domain-containing protein/glycosyltransferase involved in cell wall biosynthesis
VTSSDPYFRILFELPVLSGTNFEAPLINSNDNVSNLIDILVSRNIGAAIVVEDHRPVGIVTEKDVLEKVLNDERNLEKTVIREIMSSPVLTIESNNSVKNAIDLMRKNRIRRLVVVQDRNVIGLTTERRLLNIAHRIYLENSIEISNYPPRECGIATFTNNLVNSINELNALSPPVITAINDKGGYYNYPPQVKIQIEREEVESYIAAAKKINSSGIQALNLQHEYGLFGGVWGDYLLDFLEEIEKPVITTLHTILETPPRDAERVLKEVIRLSHRIVVIARIGSKILEQKYDTYPDKVRHIPHGCPNVPLISSETVKEVLGLNDRVTLSTFGLISRGKGIEYAIESLPEIIEREPRTLYLIIGETHPEVRKHEGESYRQSLIDTVESLGIEKNVRFVNRFLSKSELIRYLQATDVYILPYPNPEQISSGTMLYALCTGKAIVTTPFLHAQEVIKQGAATQCDFRDSKSISKAVNSLLHFNQNKRNFEKRAYEFSRDMIWPNVAMKYVNLFYESIGI